MPGSYLRPLAELVGIVELVLRIEGSYGDKVSSAESWTLVPDGYPVGLILYNAYTAEVEGETVTLVVHPNVTVDFTVLS